MSPSPRGQRGVLAFGWWPLARTTAAISPGKYSTSVAAVATFRKTFMKAYLVSDQATLYLDSMETSTHTAWECQSDRF